jgi:twitching motility protein PilU
MELHAYLKNLIELQGSDLYISAGAMPMVRVEGKISSLSSKSIDKKKAVKMIYAALTEPQIKEFEEHLELNLALHIPETGRFRINIFQQRAGISLVARQILMIYPMLPGQQQNNKALCFI